MRLRVCGAVCVLGVVACSPQPDLPILVTGGTTVHEVAFSGVLAVDEGNCVSLKGDGGDLTSTTWPSGFTVKNDDGETLIIDSEGREVATLGDNVVLGGGMAQASDEVPACAAATSTIVVTSAQRA